MVSESAHPDDEREALSPESHSPLALAWTGFYKPGMGHKEAVAFKAGFAAGYRRHDPRPVTDAEGDRHTGYLQLHDLVRDAPEGVRRAVGNDMQRVLANGSFSIHPDMLRQMLVRAHENGSQEPRPVTDAEVEAAWRTYEGIAPETSVMGHWIGKARTRMRAALEAARAVENRSQ